MMKTIPLSAVAKYVLGPVQTVVDSCDLLDQLAKDAHSGRIAVWGSKKSQYSLYEEDAAIIPSSEWRDKIIDPIAYMRDGSANCIVLISRYRDIHYQRLAFNRRQLRYLKRAWRMKRRKTVWTARVNYIVSVIARIKGAISVRHLRPVTGNDKKHGIGGV